MSDSAAGDGCSAEGEEMIKLLSLASWNQLLFRMWIKTDSLTFL